MRHFLNESVTYFQLFIIILVDVFVVIIVIYIKKQLETIPFKSMYPYQRQIV